MLKIEKLPSSLSTSALILSERQPNRYYATKLVNDPIIERDPQGLPAAVGSAFDYYIKCKLIADKFHHKEDMLEGIKKGVESNIVEAFQWGKSTYEIYAMKAFDEDEYADVELWIGKSIQYKGTKIPLYGKLDATSYDVLPITGKTIIIPFDWKLSGYSSKDTRSPYPYYYWSCENGIILKGKHKDYVVDVPFHYINEDWATQLCTYGWLIGMPPGIPFPARIDMLCFDRGKKVTITKYRGLITAEWQERVAMRYKNLWDSLMDESFLNNLASQKDHNIVWLKAQTETWFKQY